MSYQLFECDIDSGEPTTVVVIHHHFTLTFDNDNPEIDDFSTSVTLVETQHDDPNVPGGAYAEYHLIGEEDLLNTLGLGEAQVIDGILLPQLQGN